MALLLADSSNNQDASILLRFICAEYLLSPPPHPQKKDLYSQAKTGSFSLYAEEFTFFLAMCKGVSLNFYNLRIGYWLIFENIPGFGQR